MFENSEAAKKPDFEKLIRQAMTRSEPTKALLVITKDLSDQVSSKGKEDEAKLLLEVASYLTDHAHPSKTTTHAAYIASINLRDEAAADRGVEVWKKSFERLDSNSKADTLISIQESIGDMSHEQIMASPMGRAHQEKWKETPDLPYRRQEFQKSIKEADEFEQMMAVFRGPNHKPADPLEIARETRAKHAADEIIRKQLPAPADMTAFAEEFSKWAQQQTGRRGAARG